MATKIALFEPLTRQTYRRLLGWAWPYRWRVVTAICLSAMSSVLLALSLSLVVPLSNELIIPLVTNTAAPSAPDALVADAPSWFDQLKLWLLQLWHTYNRNVYVYMVLIPAMLSTYAFVQFGARYYFDWFGNRMVIDLQNEVYRKLLQQSLGFFDKARRGDLISRMANDIGVLAGSVQAITAELTINLFQVIGMLGTCVILDWKLSLMLLVLVPVIAVPMQLLSKRVRRAARESMEKRGDLNSVLVETLNGVEIVKSFHMEEYEVRRYRAENDRLFSRIMRARKARALSTPVTHVTTSITISIIIFIAVWRLGEGALSVGAIAFFIAALAESVKPMDKLAKANFILEEAMQAARRVFELLDAPPDIVDHPNAVAIPPLAEQIVFDRVCFAYEETERAAVEDFSLQVPVGSTVALVGPSGAGKSTVIKLLSRFYEVQQGKIMFDGHDLRQVTHQSLMAQLGVIMQRTVLFNDSIRRNIAYGRDDIPLDQIIVAAKAAYAHDFIMELPNGYDTRLGDMGARLSGGQAQRISIARAILKDPRVLILDEATSALDSESERAIQAALESLIKSRTTFAIAHRLSTIQHADMIVVMDAGKIVEQGTHRTLYQQKGLYRRLYDMQFNTPDNNTNDEPARETS